MNSPHIQIQYKPSLDEWLQWANIVIDRLTDCIHVYKNKEALPTGVFMCDSERQKKTEITLALLHNVHSVTDQAETVMASAGEEHDEQMVHSFVKLFGEVLHVLPSLSADMQKLLKSPWLHKFPSKIAQNLFSGHGDESQGIGSGHPEHGRLPLALTELLENEQMGDTRRPCNKREAGRPDLDARRQ